MSYPCPAVRIVLHAERRDGAPMTREDAEAVNDLLVDLLDSEARWPGPYTVAVTVTEPGA